MYSCGVEDNGGMEMIERMLVKERKLEDNGGMNMGERMRED